MAFDMGNSASATEYEDQPKQGPSPTASLETIDYVHLSDGCLDEARRLFSTCQDDGIFYLNMGGTHPLLNTAVQGIYELTHQIFQLPLSELLKYDVDKLSPLKLNGYKPLGRNRAGLKGGKDGFETYAIPKDSVQPFTSNEWLRPSLIDDGHINALRRYCQAVQVAAHAILRTLSDILQLGPNNTGRLETLHRSGEVPTPDLLRMLKYHALTPEEADGESHIAHTDLGSLTFLCTKQWGLQIQPQHKYGSKGNPEWLWVPPPPPGHVIVNIGDMLSMLTAGYLRSCRHRVFPVPGQERSERYSFVYLMRAEGSVMLRPVASPLLKTDGRAIGQKEEGRDSGSPAGHDRYAPTSEEWLRRKFMMLRGQTWEKEKSWILTGVKEVQPQLDFG